MKTVLLKFSGPLQSWGTRSHFETRRTDPYPSKSGVLGFVAAAFGFRRNQDKEICALQDLDFAVRIDQPGILLHDYHTAHTYENDFSFAKTYVTQRYYLQDAVFVVALGHEDDAWIETIHDALLHPYFSLSMGRRAAPVPADFVLGVLNGGVIETLSHLHWQAAPWYQRRNTPHLDLYADASLLDNGTEIIRQDTIVSLSQKSRQYKPRLEKTTSIFLPHEKTVTEHDAFQAVGGQDVFIQSGN